MLSSWLSLTGDAGVWTLKNILPTPYWYKKFVMSESESSDILCFNLTDGQQLPAKRKPNKDERSTHLCFTKATGGFLKFLWSNISWSTYVWFWFTIRWGPICCTRNGARSFLEHKYIHSCYPGLLTVLCDFIISSNHRYLLIWIPTIYTKNENYRYLLAILLWELFRNFLNSNMKIIKWIYLCTYRQRMT